MHVGEFLFDGLRGVQSNHTFDRLALVALSLQLGHSLLNLLFLFICNEWVDKFIATAKCPLILLS